MRFLATPRPRQVDERLLWSRDIRFVRRLAAQVPGSRLLELETGMVLIGPADNLTDNAAGRVAVQVNMPEYGLVPVDPSLPESDRYLVAMSAAVLLSGLADRIGMAQSTQVVQTKMLDYFFSLRKLHTFAFQPIVTLSTGELYEYECLFRPQMPMLPQSISSVVQAAINTDRGVELDVYIVATALERIGRLEATAREAGMPKRRYAINLTPFSLIDRAFEASALAAQVREVGLDTRQITIECTEQQSVPDIVPLQRQVKALRKLGFGFAVDDAGAGYASFALIAALRPIDHQDRPRHRPRAQPRRRQEGAGRGIRVVRPPDRCPPPGRRDRASRRPRHAQARSASSSGRATCSGSRPPTRRAPRRLESRVKRKIREPQRRPVSAVRHASRVPSRA